MALRVRSARSSTLTGPRRAGVGFARGSTDQRLNCDRSAPTLCVQFTSHSSRSARNRPTISRNSSGESWHCSRNHVNAVPSFAPLKAYFRPYFAAQASQKTAMNSACAPLGFRAGRGCFGGGSGSGGASRTATDPEGVSFSSWSLASGSLGSPLDSPLG